jgi:hypothetical protein
MSATVTPDQNRALRKVRDVAAARVERTQGAAP